MKRSTLPVSRSDFTLRFELYLPYLHDMDAFNIAVTFLLHLSSSLVSLHGGTLQLHSLRLMESVLTL